MDVFAEKIQVRWADLDPNFHIRHSVYYDWGAMSRILFFNKLGLTDNLMKELHLGPILFREECVFRKEIRMDDPVFITLKFIKARRDFSRWTILHRIMKNEETVACLLTVDGAWLDTEKRKLTLPSADLIAAFSKIPVSNSFEWLD